MFGFFGKRAKYDTFTWWENFMSGHISIGSLSIFGENAMHWAIELHTKKYGYICFTPPLKCFGKYQGCHLYFSPNGTPWAATYYKSLWKENNKDEEIRAKIRKLNFGHNFSTDIYSKELYCLNNKFSYFKIGDYDLNK
jgi:hypothetical protein